MFAVALFVVAAHAQLDRVDAKMHTRPVQARTADAVARQKGAELTVGQGDVIHAMANRYRLLGDVLEEFFTHAVGQFVDDLGIVAVRVSVLHRAAL